MQSNETETLLAVIVGVVVVGVGVQPLTANNEQQARQ